MRGDHGRMLGFVIHDRDETPEAEALGDGLDLEPNSLNGTERSNRSEIPDCEEPGIGTRRAGGDELKWEDILAEKDVRGSTRKITISSNRECTNAHKGGLAAVVQRINAEHLPKSIANWNVDQRYLAGA